MKNLATSNGTPGRNDPCPCGSGKKYKKCCMGKEQVQRRATAAMHPDLPKAINAIESGNPQTAREICQSILGVNPEDAGAWHIYGMASYQLGSEQEAEKSLKRSLEINSENPWVNSNLAIILQNQNRLEEAYPYAVKAVDLDPKNPDAQINLGNIYRKSGQLKEAKSAFLNSLKYDKKNPIAKANIGEIFLKSGQFETAKDWFGQALKIDKNYIPALNNLGVCLNKLQQFEQAFEPLNQAARLSPTDPEILVNIGLAYKGQGELLKAEKLFKEALTLDPENTLAIMNKADLEYETGNIEGCRQLLEKTLTIDPNKPEAHKRLADIFLNEGNFDLARDHYLAALKIDPVYLQGIVGLVGWFLRQDKNDKAIECLDEAAKTYADSPELQVQYSEVYKNLHLYRKALKFARSAVDNSGSSLSSLMQLAVVLQHFGQTEEARAVYEQASKLYSDNAELLLAWAKLEEKSHDLGRAEDLLEKAFNISSAFESEVALQQAIIKRRQGDLEAALQLINRVVSDNGKPPRFMQLALNERAKILDKMGEYNQAFYDYARCGELRGKNINQSFDVEGHARKIDGQISYFSREKLAMLPRLENDKIEQGPASPIFIVGFPRSGTTLLEQIMCSHPLISAGDELIFMNEIQSLSCKQLQSDKGYPFCLDELITNENPQKLLAEWQSHYLDRAEELGVIAKDTKYFTDKMPMNLTKLPLISMVFPNAPIIHIMRNPMDSALSSLFSNFTHGMAWANDITHAAHYYKDILKLVNHYRETLVMNYMMIRYEDLVAEQEKWSRKVIDFVGVEWDDRCLEFHKTKRLARTASYEQVTNKIYTSSVARYKRYEKHLGAALEILEPVMEDYGYTD